MTPSSNELLVTGGLHRITWDKLPSMPAVTLLRKQFDELADLLKDGKPVTLEFDIRNYFKKGPIKLYNVIADIPGSELPDEYVIIGGHIDSWDGATGTTDNGTGVATTLEAARILMKSGAKPRRTIRFMVWSGEEQGLLGSKAYVKAHKDLLPKISGVIVHDGGTNYLSGIGGTEAMLSDLELASRRSKSLTRSSRLKCARSPACRAAAATTPVSSRRTCPASSGASPVRPVTSTRTTPSLTPSMRPSPSTRSTRPWSRPCRLLGSPTSTTCSAELRARESSNRRMLGVQLDELTVAEVEDEGAARKAGMKEGDIIVKVDGVKIGEREEIAPRLREGAPKKVITVLRNGKEVDLTFSWAPAPEEAKAKATP